eukprot:6192664-Pleurochrysis_carterae.AAC.2
MEEARKAWSMEEDDGDHGGQELRGLREHQKAQESGDQLNQLQAQLSELQAAVGASTPSCARTQPALHLTSAPTPRLAPRTDPSVAAWQRVEARLAATQAAMDHKHTTDLNFQH